MMMSNHRFLTILMVICSISTLSLLADGRIFTRCELAKELYYKHKFAKALVPGLLCLARYGADFNTSYESEPMLDGSKSHGLFQVRIHNLWLRMRIGHNRHF